MLKSKKVDFTFTDFRGSLTQLVHSGYEQVNVLVSNAGVVRGGHYHKMATECFYVISGSVEVIASQKNEQEKKVFKKGDFFEIEPFIIHSMTFPEDCILVVLYDKHIELEDGSKDIYSA